MNFPGASIFSSNRYSFSRKPYLSIEHIRFFRRHYLVLEHIQFSRRSPGISCKMGPHALNRYAFSRKVPPSNRYFINNRSRWLLSIIVKSKKTEQRVITSDLGCMKFEPSSLLTSALDQSTGLFLIWLAAKKYRKGGRI